MDTAPQENQQGARTSMFRNRKVLIPAALVATAVVAFLAFGVFGIHTLFIDNEVDEAGPVFASGAGADAVVDSTDTLESDDNVESDDGEPAPAQDETSDADADTAAVPEAEAQPEIITVVSGDFGPISDRYNVTGVADVLTDGSEQRFLRFENFESTNGPDLSVYLRADDGSFVDLGELKGNIGDQNYEIPADVDLSVFDTVEIWCVRFNTGFGSATLA